MKIDIQGKTLFGREAKFLFETQKEKKLKEFDDKAMPNRHRRHMKSEMKLEDPEYGSGFSIKIER